MCGAHTEYGEIVNTLKRRVKSPFLFCCSVTQSCPILLQLCGLTCLSPLSMGFFQARMLEQIAISSCRGCFLPRDWTHVSTPPALLVDFLPLSPCGSPHPNAHAWVCFISLLLLVTALFFFCNFLWVFLRTIIWVPITGHQLRSKFIQIYLVAELSKVANHFPWGKSSLSFHFRKIT